MVLRGYLVTMWRHVAICGFIRAWTWILLAAVATLTWISLWSSESSSVTGFWEERNPIAIPLRGHDGAKTKTVEATVFKDELQWCRTLRMFTEFWEVIARYLAPHIVVIEDEANSSASILSGTFVWHLTRSNHGTSCKELLVAIWRVVKHHSNQNQLSGSVWDDVRMALAMFDISHAGQFSRVYRSLQPYIW